MDTQNHESASVAVPPPSARSAVSLSELCGKDPGYFQRFLVAKGAAIRLAGHREVTLTSEEIRALLEFVPELSDFCRASVV